MFLPVYLVVFSSRTDHHPSKDEQNFERIFQGIKLKTKKGGHMILTAGGLLEVQKGSSPVWAQTASGLFSILFTASVTSSSVS